MRKIVLLIFSILFTNLNYSHASQPVEISHEYGAPYEENIIMPMAKHISETENYTKKPIYMKPGVYYRTGYARPKTRLAQPNKRFAQPQTRYAHVRPKYIYTKEYQDNIFNKHNPGMKRQYDDKSKNNTNTVSRFDKNFTVIQNKRVSCGGITYYGITSACK